MLEVTVVYDSVSVGVSVRRGPWIAAGRSYWNAGSSHKDGALRSRWWWQKALTLTDTHLHVGGCRPPYLCARPSLICHKRCSSWSCRLMTQPAGRQFPYRHHVLVSCRLNTRRDSCSEPHSCQPSLMIFLTCPLKYCVVITMMLFWLNFALIL